MQTKKELLSNSFFCVDNFTSFLERLRTNERRKGAHLE